MIGEHDYALVRSNDPHETLGCKVEKPITWSLVTTNKIVWVRKKDMF